VSVRRAVAFHAGLAFIVVALVSPLDALAGWLFSAHMVQHLLLILIAPPLIVYGAPGAPLMLALPRALRRRLHAARHSTAVRVTQRIVFSAAVVWSLQTLAMWGWHLPAPYQDALRSQPLHALEHASFFFTAVLFWSLVIETGPRRKLGYGATIVLVFAAALQSAALGAVLTFASHPLYPLHIPRAAALGVGALADQQLAGLIMWVPAGTVYLITMAALFLRWLKSMEADQAAERRAAELVGAWDR
jgi:putative membrane protein